MWKPMKTDVDYPETKFSDAGHGLSHDTIVRTYISDPVLIQYEDGDMDIARCKCRQTVNINLSPEGCVVDTYFEWNLNECGDVPESKVIAWHELPKPYKEEN